VAKSPSSPGKIARTRHRLIHAIRQEVCATGDFSAERVSLRAGVSPATFYNHFATKDEALVAAYQALMTDLDDMVTDRCRIEVLLDDGLREFMSKWLLNTASFFSTHAPLFRLAQAGIARSKELRNVFRQHQDFAIQAYARLIELGQAARAIRVGDSLILAQVLVVNTQGWFHPLIQKLKPNTGLHIEMVETLVRMLRPDEH